MRRRNLILVAAASALVGVVVLVAGAIYAVTNTSWGLARVRQLVIANVLGKVNGNVYLGNISGSLLGDVQIDSLEIRDKADSLFVATGPVALTFDLRDFVDRRILLRTVSVQRPMIRLHERPDGSWNWKEIFPPSRAPKVPVPPTRGFGDFVVIDSVRVRGGTMVLIQPWMLSDTLSTRARDSILAVGRAEHELRPTATGGWEKVSRWTKANLLASRLRLAHPDSAEQVFEIAHLDAIESEPPFDIRDVRGTIRKLDDSIWVDIPRLALANSVGKAKGKIWWGGGQPQRWDIRVIGDSACMSDYAWIYATLPRTGCGRMDVYIHNERDLEIMDYELTRLDITSTKSRLRGKMTFGVGAPILIVKDVDMQLDPMDFDLARVFKGGPFPYDFQGTLRGRVKGAGGPVNRFQVEEAQLTFRDTHVPGAVSVAKGRGVLDLTVPADTKFRGFDLDIATADLRSIRYLNPGFPSLNGIVRGHVRLDSVWYDVRFRDADIEHVDGPGIPTRLLGRGRMTVGDVYTRFDVDMNAQPMSLGMLARSYPSIPILVPMNGAFTAFGKSDSLGMTAQLSAPGGALTFAGVVDVEAPIRGFQGQWTFDSLNVRHLMANDSLPVTRLTGRLDGALRGDTLLPTLEGEVQLALGRSLVDGVRVYSADGHFSFADSVMRVDSLRVDSPALSLTADGGLGLAPPFRDSLTLTALVDSLGGLRRWVGSADPTVLDTLAGTLSARAILAGNLDSLDVSALLDGAGLVRNGLRARRVRATVAMLDVRNRGPLDVDAGLDTVIVGGLAFVRAGIEARSREPSVTDVTVTASTSTGPAVSASGTVTQRGDSTVLLLDRGTVVVADEYWRLEGAARALMRGDEVRLDTLLMNGPEGARVHASGSLPARGAIGVHVGIAQVSVATLARLAGTETSARGLLDVDWRATGTRAAPMMDFTAGIADVGAVGKRKFHLDATGHYAAMRLETQLLLKEDTTVLATAAASLPLDLALEVRGTRQIAGAPLTGTVRAPAVDLAVLEAFTSAVQDAKGTLRVTADVAGTWARPRLTGAVALAGGEAKVPALGRVQLTGLEADIGFLGDTVSLRTLVAHTPPRAGRLNSGRQGTMQASGTVAIGNSSDPVFDLQFTADNFNAVAKPNLADLDVSGDVRLEGPSSGATLVGSMLVNRGTLTIPDLASKNVIDPSDPDFLRVVDTALFSDERLLPAPPSAFVNNLKVRDVRIDMGTDVWLRSAEANINLGGSVSVGRQRVVRGNDTSAAELTLDGALLVNRGTYRLNIADVVQRTFDVEQGKLTFSPQDPTFNPGLDISAVHTVRRFNSTLAQQDKKIRVRIAGTLQQPTVAFESADNTQMSQSNLISYLVTGTPSFGVGDPTESSGAVNAAANVLLTSLSSSLADRIASLGYLDYVSIQTGGLGRNSQDASGNQNPLQNQLLNSTRIGGGVQISDRVFLSGDAGYCPTTDSSVWTQLGVKLEYRLSDTFTASASVEPPAKTLLCVASARGFVLTPQQFGVDLTSIWRF